MLFDLAFKMKCKYVIMMDIGTIESAVKMQELAFNNASSILQNLSRFFYSLFLAIS